MHWIEVAGLRVPNRIGGHPALDFCNTWAGWGEAPEPRREWLKTYDQLAVWSGHAELVGEPDRDALRGLAARRPGPAAAVLTDARRLRTAVHTAILDPADERAMAAVTGFVRKAAGVVRLRPGPQPVREVAGPPRLDTPLHASPGRRPTC